MKTVATVCITFGLWVMLVAATTPGRPLLVYAVGMAFMSFGMHVAMDVIGGKK